MADRLVQILLEDIADLRHMYKLQKLKSSIAYITIDSYIQVLKKDPKVKNIKFYSLNGDFSDGTFVVIDRYNAYTDTLSESNENISRLLKLLDYSKGYIFLNIRPEMRSVITDVIKHKNLNFDVERSRKLFHLTKEEALKFDIKLPDDIQLRPLTSKLDLERAHSWWPHKHYCSLLFFERMSKHCINIGAYKDDGTMIAWIFRYPTGTLTALQTDESYFGRGYGTLVTKYVSKKIAEMGHDVYTGIAETNRPSLNLFNKLGFKEVDKIHTIITKYNWSEADE